VSGVGQREPARCAGGLDVFAGFSAPACLAVSLLLMASLASSIAGCGQGGNGEGLSERVIPLGQPVPKGGGVYRIGDPYQVAGLWYRPREDAGYDQVGQASWYGELFHGRRTANGEIYDMDRLSAAHPTLPLPVYARVTNLANGRTIVVRVNDRGPYARDRIIDLSRRSAELLDFRGNGTAQVRVKYLARAPMNGDDSYERRYLASQRWMQVAAKGKSQSGGEGPTAVGSLPGEGTLPAENPENLAFPWKAAAPPEETPSGDARLRWQTSPRAAAPLPVATTGSLPRGDKIIAQADGLLIQAGSFKSKENADKARAALSAIAPVDVDPIEVGDEVYFRVRVGPFSAANEAEAALARVTGAGYQGAKIVMKN
jgi:rare lipoprotein A